MTLSKQARQQAMQPWIHFMVVDCSLSAPLNLLKMKARMSWRPQIIASKIEPNATVPIWVKRAHLKDLIIGLRSSFLFLAKYQMHATPISTNWPTLVRNATCHSSAAR